MRSGWHYMSSVEVDKIKRLQREGLKASEIAKVMKRSTTSVAKALKATTEPYRAYPEGFQQHIDAVSETLKLLNAQIMAAIEAGAVEGMMNRMALMTAEMNKIKEDSEKSVLVSEMFKKTAG